MVKKNVGAYIIVAMMFILMFIHAADNFRAGAREYPMIVSGVGIFLSVLLVAKELYQYAKRKNDEQAIQKFETSEKKKSFTIKEIKAFVISTVAILIYLFLIPRLGYITSTFIVMLSLLIVLKRQTYFLYIALTVGLCLIIHYVFGGFLNIFLPRGMLI